MIKALSRVEEVEVLLGKNCRVIGSGLLREGPKRAGNLAIAVVITGIEVLSSLCEYLAEKEKTARLRAILEREIAILETLKLEYESLKRIKEELEKAVAEKKKLLLKEFRKKVESRLVNTKDLARERISRLLKSIKKAIFEVREEMKRILAEEGRSYFYAELEIKYYQWINKFVVLSGVLADVERHKGAKVYGNKKKQIAQKVIQKRVCYAGI